MAEEYVLLSQDLGPKEWAVEGLIQVCDDINVGIEDISLEIVPIANMDTKDHQVQDAGEEEDTILKTEIGIDLKREDLMIVVINNLL